MSRPVPPPRPTWRGVWEKEKLLERAAGVAESSGRIQVSVKAKTLSVDCKEKAEIKSALLTADWQFQRPTEKERGAVEDVEIGRRLAGLHCRLRVMLERGWDKTGMVWKHMIEVERKRIGKESVRGKIKMILKCVARFCRLVKVVQEKVVGLYTRRSSHEEAEHNAWTLPLTQKPLYTSLVVLGHQINTQSRRLQWKRCGRLLISPANRLKECK